MMPVCVGVLAGTESTTVALPVPSVATVSVWTSGCAGLVETIENDPCTTSNFTAPTRDPGAAVAGDLSPSPCRYLRSRGWPAPDAHAGFGLEVIVMPLASNAAGCTVIVAGGETVPTAS